jgi:hypothetical protein
MIVVCLEFFIVPSKGPQDILATTKGSTHISSLDLLGIYGVKAFMSVCILTISLLSPNYLHGYENTHYLYHLALPKLQLFFKYIFKTFSSFTIIFIAFSHTLLKLPLQSEAK